MSAVSARDSRLVPSNHIENPFRRGQQVVIPKGTRIHTTMSGDKRKKTAGRTHTVTVKHVYNGWVDTANDCKKGSGYVVLPSVTWAGEAGYWHDVQVTPEFCAANGVETPTLPSPDSDRPDGDRLNGDRLDVIPSYGSGYDNAWRD